VIYFNDKEDKKDNSTILKISDELWDKIRIILPKEKPSKTTGRPIIPFRKILDGILYILRTGCQWKMLPSGYGYGYGFNMSYDFKNGLNLTFLRKYG
jgi:hypothetical protein